ncbi:hypothetical protein [Puniceicoccus vermicola]|uniref:hypothetical protein n=1 Tax=Puniceicoccus vermicola TaxID=388746 RepID=UPI00163A44CE|nr:hypothetical protein [Puniceicoccus vermicola]
MIHPPKFDVDSSLVRPSEMPAFALRASTRQPPLSLSLQAKAGGEGGIDAARVDPATLLGYEPGLPQSLGT